METTTKNLGLCATCNHLQDCQHRLNDGEVIWFCEEFDDFVPLHPRLTGTKPPQPGSGNGYGELMGLCVNCDNRQDCIHALKAGGVWFCEEYR